MQLHVEFCNGFHQSTLSPDGMLLYGEVHASRGRAYPDLIDPVIKGSQLISVLVEDRLLPLLVLKQNLQRQGSFGQR